MGVIFQNNDYPPERIANSIDRILESSKLCSMATLSEDRTSHINVAYFCYNAGLEFFFISEAITIHSRNIMLNPSMSIAIYDSQQHWDDWKAGIQLFGNCRLANKKQSKEGAGLYKTRFPDYAKWLHSLGRTVASELVPPFYVFVPDKVKILDEEDFGEETYVEAQILRD